MHRLQSGIQRGKGGRKQIQKGRMKAGILTVHVRGNHPISRESANLIELMSTSPLRRNIRNEPDRTEEEISKL